ncbi:hypothetical protein [Gordonia sp. (in: high G+C Gram-positive bacteria)]|uniref:hypothetical protein n=1 Tax=Gordonia sp. (in: high G+C Gram-positive bacteria) TaxID=84139 RepID=UPI0039E25CD5
MKPDDHRVVIQAHALRREASLQAYMHGSVKPRATNRMVRLLVISLVIACVILVGIFVGQFIVTMISQMRR